MVKPKRPPVPDTVWVAWFFNDGKWIIDWTATTKREAAASVRDGIFPHRHVYREYQAVSPKGTR
jgi:P2-related tail formation protein